VAVAVEPTPVPSTSTPPSAMVVLRVMRGGHTEVAMSARNADFLKVSVTGRLAPVVAVSTVTRVMPRE
jgi:hypothetical protein